MRELGGDPEVLRGPQVPLIYSPVYVFVPSSSSYLWAVIALLSKDVCSSLLTRQQLVIFPSILRVCGPPTRFLKFRDVAIC